MNIQTLMIRFQSKYVHSLNSKLSDVRCQSQMKHVNFFIFLEEKTNAFDARIMISKLDTKIKDQGFILHYIINL
mgnify:CR=1 FL=1